MSQWLPISSMPTSGSVLIGVWEGEWRNPRKDFRVFQAYCYPTGPVWGRSYRTEEGDAWKIVGWMPMPEPPADDEVK